MLCRKNCPARPGNWPLLGHRSAEPWHDGPARRAAREAPAGAVVSAGQPGAPNGRMQARTADVSIGPEGCAVRRCQTSLRSRCASSAPDAQAMGDLDPCAARPSSGARRGGAYQGRRRPAPRCGVPLMRASGGTFATRRAPMPASPRDMNPQPASGPGLRAFEAARTGHLPVCRPAARLNWRTLTCFLS